MGIYNLRQAYRDTVDAMREAIEYISDLVRESLETETLRPAYLCGSDSRCTGFHELEQREFVIMHKKTPRNRSTRRDGPNKSVPTGGRSPADKKSRKRKNRK